MSHCAEGWFQIIWDWNRYWFRILNNFNNSDSDYSKQTQTWIIIYYSFEVSLSKSGPSVRSYISNVILPYLDMERPREPPEIFDEDFEAAEIERVFGPVDEKQQDVEQV